MREREDGREEGEGDQTCRRGGPAATSACSGKAVLLGARWHETPAVETPKTTQERSSKCRKRLSKRQLSSGPRSAKTAEPFPPILTFPRKEVADYKIKALPLVVLLIVRSAGCN